MKYILTVLLLLTSNAARAGTHSSFSERCVDHYARRYGVPPEFIAALIDVESNWNHLAISSKGAIGLMQLMPKTAARFGASSPLDIEQNIAAGTRYVTTLMWEFHGDLRLVAAAYFAGDLWVGKRRLDYTNPEVVAYVREVRRRYIARKSNEANSHWEEKTR